MQIPLYNVVKKKGVEPMKLVLKILALPVLFVLSLKTDFAMKHFRKRFAILHLVTDMKNRRQAG